MSCAKVEPVAAAGLAESSHRWSREKPSRFVKQNREISPWKEKNAVMGE
jgi:hypothetical protein